MPCSCCSCVAGKVVERRKAQSASARKAAPVVTVTDAAMELLNFPHPLDTLGSVFSYGHDGGHFLTDLIVSSFQHCSRHSSSFDNSSVSFNVAGHAGCSLL